MSGAESVSPRLRCKFIPAPNPPDDEVVAELIGVLNTVTRVAEAYVTGQRLTPTTEAPYETTDVVLVLDPPLTDQEVVP